MSFTSVLAYLQNTFNCYALSVGYYDGHQIVPEKYNVRRVIANKLCMISPEVDTFIPLIMKQINDLYDANGFSSADKETQYVIPLINDCIIIVNVNRENQLNDSNFVIINVH